MIRNRKFYNAILALLCLSIAFLGCSEKETSKKVQIVVKNARPQMSSFETVEIDLDSLQLNIELDSTKVYTIIDSETKEELISQLVDLDGDGHLNQLLFQPEIKGHSEKTFTILLKDKVALQDSIPICYSRFVPERTDDYAWENNRVAFRVYGPTAQKMVEDSIAGGTLSSGVDAWLKKVEYPIINKWYKKETETEGTYHEDTGEGLDNFHVGISRGVGGIAVKRDSVYYFSKNYTKWRTIINGPIRTSFYLEYEDWEAGGKSVKESRIISLDYGSNLSRFEISLDGVEEISTGLTLHEKDGEVSANKKEGWISYWEPHEDSELGTGIIAAPDSFLGYENYDVEEKDLSNAYAHLKVENGRVVYYAGFGWKKSDQFKNKQEWENYLNQFSERINNPLETRILP